MRRGILLAATLALGLAANPLAAEEGLLLGGSVRSKVGALLEDGSYFLAENALDVRLSVEAGKARLFANPVLYESGGETLAPLLREAYLDFGGGAAELRLGKQQIIWGKADGVFITDLVSPKDLSRFLVPDFVELRKAVTGLRLELYGGNHGLDLVWLPWFTPTTLPAAGSLWAPDLPFPIAPTFVAADSPELGLESGEYFAKYSYFGAAFDLSLMGGYFWNDSPAYEVVAKTLGPGGLSSLSLRPVYYRSYAAGYAVSGNLGPLVLRSEGAFFGGRRFQGNPIALPEGYAVKNELQYLLGADFSLAGSTFGLQLIQNYILEHEAALVEAALKTTGTFTLSRSFLRETLRAELFVYLGFEAPDALIRPKLTWNFSDALELFAGAYLFLGEGGDFGQYRGNDGLYAGAKLSF